MKLEKKHYIIIGVVVVIIVWYFFLRKKKAESSWTLGGGSKLRQPDAIGVNAGHPMSVINLPTGRPGESVHPKSEIIPPVSPDYTGCINNYNAAITFSKSLKGLQRMRLVDFANRSLNACKPCVTGCYDIYNKEMNSERDRAQAPWKLRMCTTKCTGSCNNDDNCVWPARCSGGKCMIVKT